LGFIGKGFNDLSLEKFALMMTTLEISVHKSFSVLNTACGLIILTSDSSPFLDIYCHVCMIVCTYVHTYVCTYVCIMYVRKYVCMYVRTYVYMYVFMYYVCKNICIYVHKYAMYLRTYVRQCTVIPRLTKIIRSGITFVSRNLISRRFL
jgi:hypothetical protein